MTQPLEGFCTSGHDEVRLHVDFKGSTADAAELFKRNMDDPDAAWAALTEETT